jgi:hypothetical protein
MKQKKRRAKLPKEKGIMVRLEIGQWEGLLALTKHFGEPTPSATVRRLLDDALFDFPGFGPIPDPDEIMHQLKRLEGQVNRLSSKDQERS